MHLESKPLAVILNAQPCVNFDLFHLFCVVLVLWYTSDGSKYLPIGLFYCFFTAVDAYTYYQQFRFVDFNVIFSYLLLVMFFFHLSHSIHAQLSTVFTETYLNITYIISHLRSTSLGRRKWFYVICLSLFYRGSHMFYFVAQ